MTDEEIINKLDYLFSRMEANNQLKKLADENGLDIKNSIELTDEDKDNYAVTIVSLLLAKRNNDQEYQILKRVGLKRREVRTSIVNKYKNDAIDLIKKYKSA